MFREHFHEDIFATLAKAKRDVRFCSEFHKLKMNSAVSNEAVRRKFDRSIYQMTTDEVN